jgi:DNA gyrase subunit A
MLITRNGYALRFEEKEVRPMNRPAMGVIGIRLRENDQVVGMDVVEKGGDLLVITEKGYGKRTSLDGYPRRGRATMGVLTVDKKALGVIGNITAARVVQPKGDLITVISAEGTVMRTKAETISQYNRVARGVSIMQMREDDVVVAIARFAEQDMDASDIEQTEDLPKVDGSPELAELSEKNDSPVTEDSPDDADS